MNPKEIEKIVYTVECFFNASRTPDSRERTQAEEKTSRWLINDSKNANGKAYAIYQDKQVFLYNQAGVSQQSFSLPEAAGSNTIWCDGKKISALDREQFQLGTVALIGSALILTMPGLVAAGQQPKQEKETNSNNNNNNNNNNNG